MEFYVGLCGCKADIIGEDAPPLLLYDRSGAKEMRPGKKAVFD